MIVNIPDNSLLVVNDVSQEVYLVINDGVIFDKDIKVFIIKKVSNFKNEKLQVIPESKFNESFSKLKSLSTNV